MNDERFEQLLEEGAREYHRPPETPRERIWAGVQARRRERRRWRGIPRLAKGLLHWPWWPLPVGAALAAGILIGLTISPDYPDSRTHATFGEAALAPYMESGDDAGAASDSRVAWYTHAAGPYLGRVEALLTVAHTERTGSPGAPRVSAWAEELLTETRLLLDSPAAEDREMRLLLDDLELVLAQIALLSHRQAGGGRDWIRSTIDRRSLMLRLRDKMPAEPLGRRI